MDALQGVILESWQSDRGPLVLRLSQQRPVLPAGVWLDRITTDLEKLRIHSDGT